MLAPNQVIERHHLEVRARLLELAAVLDRLDRAREQHSECGSEGDERSRSGSDTRESLWQEALKILLAPADGADRAERLQLLFSREYRPQWRGEFGV